MKRAACILMLMVCGINLPAQLNVFQVRVTDSISGDPIAMAEAVNLADGRKFLAGNDGWFVFSSRDTLVRIQVFNLSYHPQIVVLRSGSPVASVRLLRKTFELTGVEVRPCLPDDILSGQRFYVTDYEFMGDSILLLGYYHNQMSPPFLVLLGPEGDTLSSLAVYKAEELRTDYMNRVFLVTRRTTWEVAAGSGTLSLIHPTGNPDFNALNSPIAGYAGNHYYLRLFALENQALLYFNYDEVSDTLFRFRTITNNGSISRNRWGAYFGGTDADQRFRELIVNRPLYAPLLTINDTVYLFNFPENKIELYTLSSELIRKTDISFHLNRDFSEQLIVDKAVQKVYGATVSNGITRLYELDIKSGTPVNTFTIPDFVFVDEIKIHRGAAYFLYKEKKSTEYKKLYKLKI